MVAIVIVLAAIAVPFLLPAKASANEAAALKDLRAAQQDTQSGPGNGTVNCADVPDSFGGTKSGYVFGCSGGQFWARPEVPGRTGTRGFSADATGRICFTTDGTIPVLATCQVLK